MMNLGGLPTAQVHQAPPPPGSSPVGPPLRARHAVAAGSPSRELRARSHSRLGRDAQAHAAANGRGRQRHRSVQQGERVATAAAPGHRRRATAATALSPDRSCAWTHRAASERSRREADASRHVLARASSRAVLHQARVPPNLAPHVGPRLAPVAHLVVPVVLVLHLLPRGLLPRVRRARRRGRARRPRFHARDAPRARDLRRYRAGPAEWDRLPDGCGKNSVEMYFDGQKWLEKNLIEPACLLCNW